MGGGDGRLDVIFRDPIAIHATVEVVESQRDQGLVPKAAVLIVQQNEIAAGIDAGGEPGGLERHKGEQSMNARGGERGGGKHPAQSKGFAAEIVTDQRLALVHGVAFIEDQVDDFEDRVEAAFEVGFRGHFEGQAAIADLALGADETLCDGFVLGEEGARDFANAEAADGFEAQRNA